MCNAQQWRRFRPQPSLRTLPDPVPVPDLRNIFGPQRVAERGAHLSGDTHKQRTPPRLRMSNALHLGKCHRVRWQVGRGRWRGFGCGGRGRWRGFNSSELEVEWVGVALGGVSECASTFYAEAVANQAAFRKGMRSVMFGVEKVLGKASTCKGEHV